MTHPRTVIAVVAAALLVVVAVLLAHGCDTLTATTPIRQLEGPAQPGSFAWVSADHAVVDFEQVEPPVQPPSAPPLPLRSDVTFDHDSVELRDPAEVNRLIEPHVVAARGDPALTFTIDAFASADGDATHNMELSLGRGEAIRAQFAALGVDPARVTVIAHGEADLPVPGDPTSAENRVVIVAAHTGGAAR